MSKGFEVSGVKSDAKAATYVYTLSADSGYRANETGRISADRHGLVCRALAGKLDDYDQLDQQRAELLEMLQRLEKAGENMRNTVVESRGLRYMDAHDFALRDSRELIERIANATQQRNATGGEG